MTIIEWLEKLCIRFKKETGRKPDPFDVARNLPTKTSDGDAMRAMVAFMEKRDN